MLLYMCLLIGSLLGASLPQEGRLSKKLHLSIPIQSALSELPYEIKAYVRSYLDKEDKKSLSSVCSDFHSITQKDMQKIRIFLRRIAPSDAQKLLSKLENLKEIEFYNIDAERRLVPIHLSVNTILSHAPQIKSLDFSDQFWVTDYTLVSLNALTNLTFLNLENCANITDEGVEVLPSSIRSLSLNACANITDVGIKTLPPNLTRLELDYCYRITDAGLRELSPNLTSLSLGYCVNITDAGLKALPLNLTYLKLDYCWITDAGLKALPSSLRSLSLNACENITDAGLKVLPSSLRSLSLSECEITDTSLKELSPNLTSLSLDYCYRITDAGLKVLPPNLTSLGLSDFEITDAGLKVLPSSLTFLNLSECDITDAGLKHLIRLENLRVLNLEYNFLDETIQELKNKLPKLTVIR